MITLVRNGLLQQKKAIFQSLTLPVPIPNEERKLA